MKKPWLLDGKFKSLTTEGKSELDNEQILAYSEAKELNLKQELDAIRAELKTVGEKASEENNPQEFKKLKDLEKELNTVKNDTLKSLIKQMETMGKVISEFQQKSVIGSVEEDAEMIIKAFTDRQSDLDGLKTNSGSIEIEVATKADVTTASVIDSTQSVIIPSVGKVPVRNLTLENILRSVTVTNSGGKIKYVDQKTLNRNANNVAECAPIPESEIDWEEKEVSIKKIGDSIPVCSEALEDFSFIRSEIEIFLMENIMLKLDEQYLLGTGIGDEITGIDSIAQTWSVGVGSPIECLASSVQTPTIGNVVSTGARQITESGGGSRKYFNPTLIMMNGCDSELMLLTKDADGNSQADKLVTIGADGTIRVKGIPVIDNPLVPVDEAYIMDTTKAVVYSARGMTLTIATQHASDFLEDRIRLKGTLRKALVIRNVHANAFLHVPSIEAAKIALTKA